MFSALFSFLSGSAFRMVWGELSAWFKAKQDHAYEIERMRLQGELEAAQHARNLEAIKVQADLGVKVIEAQREADVARVEADAWLDAVRSVGRQTGIKFVDIWNGVIRPGLATIAIVAVVAEIVVLGFLMTEWHKELFGAILGIYVADRSLAKRGK